MKNFDLDSIENQEEFFNPVTIVVTGLILFVVALLLQILFMSV